MNKITHTKQQDVRQTIGLLIANVTRPWERRQWSGVVDAARDRDVNMLCFAGEALRNPSNFSAQRNVLYDLVDEARIDGLVLWLGIKIPWLGRLPGDIVLERENFKFYLPIATCILVSVIISILFFILSKFK